MGGSWPIYNRIFFMNVTNFSHICQDHLPVRKHTTREVIQHKNNIFYVEAERTGKQEKPDANFDNLGKYF